MRKIFLTIISLVLPLVCGAQALKGSYFLDNSLNRHELNPAFAPRADYVQLLGIGNMGFSMDGNMDLRTFFYPKDGEMLTFLHPSISASDFDKALAKTPRIGAECSTTLLGFGFYTGRKSYWTFDLDLRANVDAALPRDLFTFLKKGTGASSRSMNVGKINMSGYTGIQASLGYSRLIFEGLRVGAKARLIAPVTYYAVDIDKMTLETSSEKWSLKTEGYAHTALNPNLAVMNSEDIDLTTLISKDALAGFGYSFDLGAEYVLEKGTCIDGLTVSAAVTDLGCIHYDESAVSSYVAQGNVEWTGIEDVENLESALFDFTEVANNGRYTRSTMPKVHIGAEMPFLKNMMSVGVLYSARFGHYYTTNELMVSYNFNPCRWFAMGLNYSFQSAADSMGVIMEFTPRVGPAFYIGCDYIPMEYASVEFIPIVKMLPLSMKYSLNFGLAFHIGGKTTKN